MVSVSNLYKNGNLYLIVFCGHSPHLFVANKRFNLFDSSRQDL